MRKYNPNKHDFNLMDLKTKWEEKSVLKSIFQSIKTALTFGKMSILLPFKYTI